MRRRNRCSRRRRGDHDSVSRLAHEAGSAEGPVYKICWSHESLDPAAHLVELGVFTKNGPPPAVA